MTHEAETYIPQSRRFTLNGKPVDVGAFVERHGLAMPDLELIAGLEVGQCYVLRRGRVYRLRRVV